MTSNLYVCFVFMVAGLRLFLDAEVLVILGMGDKLAAPFQTIPCQVSGDVFTPHTSTCGKAEISASVSRGITGATQSCPFDGAVQNFGVRAETVKRTAGPKADGSITEFKLLTCCEFLHNVLWVELTNG